MPKSGFCHWPFRQCFLSDLKQNALLRRSFPPSPDDVVALENPGSQKAEWSESASIPICFKPARDSRLTADWRAINIANILNLRL
jgi:hypothetical protein